MDEERIAFENDRLKVYEELHKIQRKLEDEIKLRLFFESKLNSLHHINMDHESRHKLLSEKFEKLTCNHERLTGEHETMKCEHESLTSFKV